jgi:hypothetical protein
MTRSTASPLPSFLRRVLDRYRRRWRAVNFQKGLFLTLGLVAAAVGLAVVADRLLRLAPTWRTVALVAIAVLFVAGIARWVIWPIARRITDRDAALRVGRRFPQMEEDLVSAVELSADAREGRDEMSHSLVTMVLDRISQRASGKVDHRAAVSLRPMVVAGGVFVLVAAAFLTAYLIRPEAIENALARLLVSNKAFFSYTTVELSPGDKVIRQGDTAEVVVSLSGRQTETASLEGQSGKNSIRAMLACSDGRAEWKSGPLYEDMVYRVKAGDGLSEWYHIWVVQAPALRAKSAVIVDPAYAGGDEHLVENVQGTLEIVEGTRFSLICEPTVRGEEAELRCQGVLVAGNDRFPMKVDERGALRSPRFTALKSGEYQLLLTDGYNLESRTPDSTFVKVKSDALPSVGIADPGHDLVILQGENVEIEADAQDDFGVRELVLCQRKLAGKAAKVGDSDVIEVGPWDRRTLRQGGIRARNLSARTALDIVGMGITPGATLEYMAEASDFAGEARDRRANSPAWRVTVLSIADHLEKMTSQMRDLQADLLRLAALERAEAAKLSELEKRADKESVAAAAQDAKDRQNNVIRNTEEAVRKMDALIGEMVRNPSTPVESMTGMEQLSRAVSSVANKEMSEATKDLGKAGESKQGEQKPSLDKAEKSETSAADKLEGLAGQAEKLQKTTALGKLANDAMKLKARQDELKDAAGKMAPKTAGRKTEDLDAAAKKAVEQLAETEKNIKAGIEQLTKDIQQASTALAFSAPSEAEAAQKAGEKLEQDKTADQAGSLAKQMGQNSLFSSLGQHDKVSKSLGDVGEMLKKAGEKGESLDAMLRQIDEFRQRQSEINGQTSSAIEKKDPNVTPAGHGNKQANLGREVNEQASALKELAEEIEEFDSKTADRLAKAASEMKAGAANLQADEFPAGLEHGKNALALLQEAKKDLEEEGGKMGGGQQARQNMAALLQLQKILKGQKQVNRDTDNTAQEKVTDENALKRKMGDLADRQSNVRQDTRKLEEMLADMEGALEKAALAGQKMDLSRMALSEGDVGDKTRQVQKQIILTLEGMVQEQKQKMKSGGSGEGQMTLAQMRTQAIMMMMESPGPKPGGYRGGTNAPILPANVKQVTDESWRKLNSRFADKLSEGAQETYPVQFRDLLNAYFDRLRKEPPK